MRWWLKWPLIAVLCLVALVGLARLSLMTGPVHRWIKGFIVDAVQNQLNPRLSVGNLSGDLWNEITLTDITLTEDSTVASVDTLHAEYDLLSYFGDAFRINELRAVNPFMKIEQRDSTFNLQSWVKPAAPDTAAGNPFAFSISNISISGGRMDASIPQIQPESNFLVDSLNLAASLSYQGDRYSTSISDVQFNIKNTRLQGPATFKAAAGASESSLSLESLVIATAHSMLKASGQADLADSSAYFQANAAPLGWQDLAAYADSLPVKKDLDISLSFDGRFNDFEAELQARAEGIDQLVMTGSFRGDSALALTTFNASARRLDLETFLDDTTMPGLQNFEVQLQGQLPLKNYQQGQLEGTLSAQNLQQGTYRLDALQGTVALNGGNAKIRLEPVKNRQRLVVNANLSRIWSSPSVYVSFSGNKINPNDWLPEAGYSGSLTFNAEVSGTGWVPDGNLWDYSLTVNRSTLMDQRLDKATFRGRFNLQTITTRSQIAVADSRLQLQGEIQDLQSVPDFSYNVQADDLNLADFNALRQYPSSINATLQGKGRGRSLADLQLQTSVNADSSTFKGELIDELALRISLADSVATIQQGSLNSTIADAGFDGHINIIDLYSTDNRLKVNIKVKDISSFASVAGVEILQAGGQIEGELGVAGQDSLIFTGRVDLSGINYDSQFIADQISGDVDIELDEQPSYNVNLSILQPTISSVSIQNINVKTEGAHADTATAGSFEITLEKEDKGRIYSAGNYRLTADTTSVTLNRFDLTSTLRTLSLQDSFHASYRNAAIMTDTLRINSKDGSAFMELAVPYADTLRQRAYFQADNLNLAVIQDAIFGKAYLEGTVFGEAHLNRSDTNLDMSTDIVMSDLVYRQTELDTLRLRADVENERLDGMMRLYQDGDLIVEGSADIPFSTTDPEQLPESFFESPVSGKLQLHAVNLSRFSTLLEEAGYENTSGTLQFDGTLAGRAGQPKLNATLSLKEAKLSGVQVDSLIASANYDHQNSMLNLQASLTSLQQEALRAEAKMPLHVDLRAINVALPDPDDEIAITVVTDDFNLKAVNDFMNNEMARNLQGRVNGRVELSGPRSDLQSHGQLTLQDGAVRVVRAGIRLDNIRSTVRFEPDRIVLENMRMESGNGRLTARGEVEMERLIPGDLNITVDARNFRAAKTEQLNALVNLGLKIEDSISSPDITGNVEVISGFVELDNFGEKSVEQVQLDTTLTPETETSLYDSLRLDMNVEFDRRFFVRNKRYLEMEVELEGQLDFLKDPGQELQLFGTLSAADGYARPLGKRFELEEGSLAFSGPPDNPQVNIRTLYEPPQAEQEVKIWYIIDGTVEDPQFRYESQPPMDLAGIVSYTLFGQPFYKLNPAEQSVASTSSSSMAADFAMEVLLDRLESIATGRLGIDVVRIENTRIGGESGTSITTGWYVNPKVFFAIQNVITGSTPTTGFYLEYYLEENLKLILSQGNENRQGIDLQWEHDY